MSSLHLCFALNLPLRKLSDPAEATAYLLVSDCIPLCAHFRTNMTNPQEECEDKSDIVVHIVCGGATF